MLSRKQHSFSRYHFMRRIRVLALLSLICFLSFSRAALAQETKQENYAGSTNVKAYVIAASEDIPEKDGEQPKDSGETDVKAGDERIYQCRDAPRSIRKIGIRNRRNCLASPKNGSSRNCGAYVKLSRMEC